MSVTDAGLNEDVLLPSVVRRAASLLPALVDAVERCRTDPDPGQALARACGALISAMGRLRDDLWLVPRSPRVEYVDRLLYSQQRIVEEASLLAFRPRSPNWSRVANSFGDGLTDASDELLDLAATL
jgi:hypothetical protein